MTKNLYLPLIEVLDKALSRNYLATQSYEMGNVIPILLLRTQSFEVRCLAQGQTGSKAQSKELKTSSNFCSDLNDYVCFP